MAVSPDTAEALIQQIQRSVGANGLPLPPRTWERPDKADGPILIPHYSGSRFITQMIWGQRDGTEAVVTWRQPWAETVTRWAEGLRLETSEGLKTIVCDVVGLAPQFEAKVKEKAFKWWAGQVKAGRVGASDAQWGATPEEQTHIQKAIASGTWSGWRKPPPRPPGSIFAAPKPVPLVPSFDKPLPSWTIVQQLHSWLDDSEATEAQGEDIVRMLGETQTEEVLCDVARRFGVPAQTIGANPVEAIRRVLLYWSRWVE